MPTRQTNTLVYALMICLFSLTHVSLGQFERTWQDIPWSNGGLTPTGSIWSLDGFHDFDQDGQSEFYLSSSWGGSYGIDAMLYEYQSRGSYQIIWYAWFNQLDLSDSSFSVITHCDLDNDQLPELVVFLDAPAGMDSLYIYEFDPVTGLFPSEPTTSWNLNVTWGIEEVGAIQANDIDNDGNQELVLYFYAASPGTARLMVVQLNEDSLLEAPIWSVEMDDASTFAYYGYILKITDLDSDGLKEIIVVEWNYCRLVIYEDGGYGSFKKKSDLFLTFEPLAFSNDGIVEIDVDLDGFNELYLASTAGYLWVIKNQGDVSQISFEDSFTLIHDFMAEGGHVPTQLKILEMPGSNSTVDPTVSFDTDVCMYLATTDVNATQSNLFEIRYVTGDPTLPSNYTITSVFRENKQNDELFKISKFGLGDSNGNGLLDIVLGSFSLDYGKPHIIVLEDSDPDAVSDTNTWTEPGDNDPDVVSDTDTSTDPGDCDSGQQHGNEDSKGRNPHQLASKHKGSGGSLNSAS